MEDISFEGALSVISKRYARFVEERAEWSRERQMLRQRISNLEGEKIAQDTLVRTLMSQVESLKAKVHGKTSRRRMKTVDAYKTVSFEEFQERYRSLTNKSWMKKFSARKSYKPVLRQYISDLGLDLGATTKANKSASSATMKPKRSDREGGANKSPFLRAKTMRLKKEGSSTAASFSPSTVRSLTVSAAAAVSAKRRDRDANDDDDGVVDGGNENDDTAEKKVSKIRDDGERPTGMKRNAGKKASLPTGLTRTYRWKRLRKTSVLRNHLDSVRSLDVSASSLVSGGDDGTVKIWSTVGAKTPELLCSYRGHRGAVFATKFISSSSSSKDGLVASAGRDSVVKLWRVPCSSNKPRGETLVECASALRGHTDIVWSLASTSNGERMLSASADGSLRLWNLDGSIKEKENDALCLGRIAAETSAVPTSVDFVATDAARAVYGAVGGGGAAIVLVDVERMTNVSAIRFPSSSATTQDSMHIYQIASHPAEPTVVSAHEDGHLRLCDTRSGRCELEILAHRDAASCLAIDPKGRFVVSGSHDGSVRVWSLGERKMVQDIPDAHLKHFDTGVGAVAFSPDGTQVMTGGGDGVFVNAYAQSVGAY